jgi:branched-chain amino acid transport system ATP-binding protein
MSDAKHAPKPAPKSAAQFDATSGPKPDVLLTVENLEAGYGEVQVLWGLSLQARRGKLTAIVGANGAGKTTTLRAVVGAIAPWRGRVVFEDEDVTHMPTHLKAARGVALVPEGRQLFSAMSVAENLELGAFAKRGARSYADRLDQVFTLFPRLAERRRQRAGTLSGGEQQMVAIARGLMSEPDILIIDELSLGLAPVVVYQLLATLKQLKEAGLTILLVEQNVHLALALSDYAYVVAEGRIFMEGLPAELAAKPEIRRAYLGL